MNVESKNPTMSKIIIKNKIEKLPNKRIDFFSEDTKCNKEFKTNIDIKNECTIKKYNGNKKMLCDFTKNSEKNLINKFYTSTNISIDSLPFKNKLNQIISNKFPLNEYYISQSHSCYTKSKTSLVTFPHRGFGKRYSEFEAKIIHEKNKENIFKEKNKVKQNDSIVECTNDRTYEFHKLLGMWKSKTDLRM